MCVCVTASATIQLDPPRWMVMHVGGRARASRGLESERVS